MSLSGSPPRPLAVLITALSFALLVAADPAGGHAKLVKAVPAPDSILRAVPATVRVWFNEELDSALSSLTVFGPRGVTAVSGTGGVDLNDLTHRSMVAKLRPLRAGVYTVRWRAGSADDLAVTQGSYQFTVRP